MNLSITSNQSHLVLSPPCSPATTSSFQGITSSKSDTAAANQEASEQQQRLEQRSRQIIYGKVTIGYLNLQQLLAQGYSGPRPMTPRPDQQNSKKKFDPIVKAWRRNLHRFDPTLTSATTSDPKDWVSPALQAAFNRLAYYYPNAQTPKKLIEGECKLPATLVLDCIDSYFFQKRIDQDLNYLQKIEDSANILIFDTRRIRILQEK